MRQRRDMDSVARVVYPPDIDLDTVVLFVKDIIPPRVEADEVELQRLILLKAYEIAAGIGRGFRLSRSGDKNPVTIITII